MRKWKRRISQSIGVSFTLTLISSSALWAAERPEFRKPAMIFEGRTAYDRPTSISTSAPWSFWAGSLGTAGKKVQVQMAIPEDSVSDDKDYRDSVGLSIELRKGVTQNLSLGVAAESFSQRSKSGASAPQSVVHALFLPRFETQGRTLQLWSALGAGLTNIHQAGMIRDEGSLRKDNLLALTVSPRVGADLKLSSTLALGAQAGYSWTSGLTEQNASVSGDTVPFQYGQTIRYAFLGLRLGLSW